MLGVEALAISEDDAKFYLHSRPLTRAEAEKRRVKSFSANGNKKREDARLQKVIEDAARPTLIQQLVEYGVESEENLSHVSTPDLAAMNLAELDRLYRMGDIEMPMNVGTWSQAECSLFEEGVVAHGWGKWKLISDDFVKSRDRVQVRSHGLAVERKKTQSQTTAR